MVLVPLRLAHKELSVDIPLSVEDVCLELVCARSKADAFALVIASTITL